MINRDRIVPVNNTDLLTLYALILSESKGVVVNIVPVDGGVATFPSSGDEEGVYICNEPVKSIHAGAEVESATWSMYFIPAYDFDGIHVFNQGMETSVVTEARAYGSNYMVPFANDATTMYFIDSSGIFEVTPTYYED
ncbi:MAG: hypothetical protein IJG86_00125 [Clostridia bacterium]|nr:hypothetical protein [Clostridia bacterium]